MDYFLSTTLREFEKMLEHEKDAAKRQRLLVLWHKKKGKTERQIEEILKIPRATTGLWVRKFRKEGIKSFQRKEGSGGHNKYLTDEQEKELRQSLRKNPMTTKEVIVKIKKEYGKEYHPNYAHRFLRRIGQSLITPRKRHYMANPRSGWAFKGHIKKSSYFGKERDIRYLQKTRHSYQ